MYGSLNLHMCVCVCVCVFYVFIYFNCPLLVWCWIPSRKEMAELLNAYTSFEIGSGPRCQATERTARKTFAVRHWSQAQMMGVRAAIHHDQTRKVVEVKQLLLAGKSRCKKRSQRSAVLVPFLAPKELNWRWINRIWSCKLVTHSTSQPCRSPTLFSCNL